MYKRLVATDGENGTQSLTPCFDRLNMRICINNLTQHYLTTISFKTEEEFINFYNNYKADDTKYFGYSDMTVKDYIILPSVFECDIEDIVDSMSKDEMAEYIRSGNTNYYVPDNTTYDDLDILGYKYMNMPRFIDEQQNIREFKGYLVGDKYQTEINNIGDLDGFILDNHKFIKDEYGSNFEFLYSVCIQTIQLTDTISIVGNLIIKIA